MKTTTVLTTLFALLGASINGVSAGCFTSGDVWQDEGAARTQVESACREGAFTGNFAAGEAKRSCFQFSGTQKFDFFIQNLDNVNSFDLDDDECILRLQNEINGCDMGGDSTIGSWRFISDPNNGIC